MPKESFTVEGATPLSRIPKGSRIHVLGVCGVAMAQLAVLLEKEGYVLSGSDREYYEPMRSLLEASTVSLNTGYRREHVPEGVALVVIGNSISYGNPELKVVEEQGIPYTFFPKVLYESVISGTHSIVIAGTHGKSTTSALCASVLEKTGASPGYFIGAQVHELPLSLHKGAGGVTVVEGDEYDSAFFAKLPKFHFYRPDTLVVTSIEFDHADIYVSLEAIVSEFDRLIQSMPAESSVVCCVDSEVVRERAAVWRRESKARIITYGTGADADVRLDDRKVMSDGQEITFADRSGGHHVLKIPLLGVYNALNAIAVFAALSAAGYAHEGMKGHFSTFQGVRRRQEVRFDGAVTLIEDFAHHPTAVRETVRGIVERYPGRRIWAIFEPRSNTSRRKVFQSDYARAFTGADQVILCDVAPRPGDDAVELLEVEELARDIRSQHIEASVLADSDAIQEFLRASVVPGDVVLLMSNGSFGGLPGAMQRELERRFER
jgi:UDP-N-acetylmuramate: L-alanyl-gamma-D-glutamyl-meso-diaminopimelate ligase